MSRTPRALAAVALTTVAGLALSVVPADAASRPRFTPGAPGAGDPYFPDMGNGGYDVAHYDVGLKYNPATKRLNGATNIKATARKNLSRFNLDLLGPLKVHRVLVNGKRANFRRTGAQELVIRPRKGLLRGKKFNVSVVYSGVPQTINDPTLGVSGWVPTDDGAVALNQPFGTAAWMPVNDTPKDKASYRFSITVPKGLVALSNGDFAGKRTRHGQTTWKWSMPQPMASELAMVAIGKYNLTRGKTPIGKNPSITAIDPTLDTVTGQRAEFHKRTNDITDWGSKVFGKYPFRSTGGIVDSIGVGYALETQGRPVYDRKGRPGVNPSVSLVTHEIAHQWYGNSVTPRLWKDIWLNEGFATYASWLQSEQSGSTTAQQFFDQTYATPAEDGLWKLVMSNPGRDNIFHDVVYDRGAMTLHVIRKTIGDKKFFRLIKSWATQNRYGNVTTRDFHRHAERVAGRQLDDLFNKWVYTAGKPTL